MQKKLGFTLVELSIAVVIVGLLIGGILIGSSLIESSKLNSVINLAQQYKVLAHQFNEKFRCLPGDCSTTIIGPSGGNANNIIEAYDEQQNVMFNIQIAGFYQSNASLVSCNVGTPGAAPIDCYLKGKDKSSYFIVRNYIATTGSSFNYGPYDITGLNIGENWIAYGKYNNANTYHTTNPESIYTGAQVAAIDKKADDGLPNTGSVRVFYGVHDNGSPNQCISGTNSWSIYNNPSALYNTTSSQVRCNPYFYLQYGRNIQIDR